MNWLLQRYSDNGNSTQGLFFQKTTENHLFHSHSLEDEYREVKVMGETRFDAGTYELKISAFLSKKMQKKHLLRGGDYLVLKNGIYQKTDQITELCVNSIIDDDLFVIDQLSPLTVKHRIAYNIQPFGNWFKHHIEITGLPRHKSVYVHAGNSEKHTDACLLLGDIQSNHMIGPDKMLESIPAVKRFYDICYPFLLSGNKSFIEIRDEKTLR